MNKKRDIFAKPRYIPGLKFPTLAYVQGDFIQTIHGDVSFHFTNWQEFCELKRVWNLYFFVDNLTDFPFFEQFVEEGIVFAQEGMPWFGMLRKTKNHPSMTLICSKSWGFQHMNIATLKTIQVVYDLCGVGAHPSPGSLAYAIYAHEQYKKYGSRWRSHRHIRCSSGASEYLERYKRGARVEVFVPPDMTFLYVDELDRYGAYLADYMEQPTGKDACFMHDTSSFVYWIAECTVTLYSDFSYGLVGSKEINGESFHDIQWIKERGTYKIVIGQHEKDLLESAGCDVQVGYGYGWYETTDDTALYSTRMEYLRSHASDTSVRTIIKRVGLAGIGRDGMSQDMSVIRKNVENEDTDIPYVIDKGLFYGYWIHDRVDTCPKSMPHWYANTTEKARVSITELIYQMATETRVLAVNTDGVYVERCSLSQHFPLKGERKVNLGEVIREEHEHVTFEAVGHVNAESGKKRHPGKKKLA